MALRAVMASLVLTLLAAGCVKRFIEVRSDPPGARVFLDGLEVGRTEEDRPCRIPFEFYGTREILLRKEGYHSLATLQEIRPPLYERFPLDLFTEHLIPWTIRDVHRVEVQLEPIPEAFFEERMEEVRARAAAAKERASK